MEDVIKYPDCVVELSGQDGNIFGVIAHARTSLYQHLTTNEIMLKPEARSEVQRMTDEITAQESYATALAAVTRWLTVT